MDEEKIVPTENGSENAEVKLNYRTLFNKQGELSSLRCAIFSIKVFLWSWLLLIVPMMLIAGLLGFLGAVQI